MPLNPYICVVCDTPFQHYYTKKMEEDGVKEPHVCSRVCQYEHMRRTHKAPHLTELNRQPGRNAKIGRDNAEKIRNTQIAKGKNNGRTYAKFFGRHEHRVVAEKKLGRPLLPGEIVHHEDENKRNNDEENLEVFDSQSDHARYHGKYRLRLTKIRTKPVPVQDDSIQTST